MANEAIQQMVLEQALTSKSNLTVACAVFHSFDTIFRKVIDKFVKALQKELTVSLGGEWEVEAEAPGSEEGKLLRIGKKDWIRVGPIVLGMDQNNSKFYLGIMKAEPLSQFWAKNEDDLRGLLTKLAPRTYTCAGWTRYWHLEHKGYRNPTSAEGLCAMYFETSEVVQYFKDAIERCAKAVEPVMDRCRP